MDSHGMVVGKCPVSGDEEGRYTDIFPRRFVFIFFLGGGVGEESRGPGFWAEFMRNTGQAVP